MGSGGMDVEREGSAEACEGEVGRGVSRPLPTSILAALHLHIGDPLTISVE